MSAFPSGVCMNAQISANIQAIFIKFGMQLSVVHKLLQLNFRLPRSLLPQIDNFRLLGNVLES